MKGIRYLVVHCSDTPNDREVTAAEINSWHRKRGWDGIGYHAVIRRDGTVEAGRPPYWVGAHVQSFNGVSLGVCLVGRDHFTEAQMEALEGVLREWQALCPEAVVVGHRDLDSRKTCPNFDAALWWAGRRRV
ncbi:N-acetylmuramoyl-L-alanine amidase [Desulfobotulus sp.]|uniref:N-acetylmuramoyl-L-alanine amidase n=1 Tax=Desulfobotulus sp. TaxID=1940337 RepID=UPI002A36E99B|nr:N-acetylmuramoyl-L-alanine amidase [Desulfobotulus sp.]MDY0164645.1 N-acetylmuramoyl-L-alanine amidase [Desulfobotulus sp.]